MDQIPIPFSSTTTQVFFTYYGDKCSFQLQKEIYNFNNDLQI